MTTQNLRQIEKLDFHPKFISVLRNAKLFTAKSIIALSVPELQRETKLSKQEVYNLLSTVAHSVLKEPTFVTAFQLNSPECPPCYKLQRLTLGCPILNQFLHGGILLDHITEISGESASGKTQFCLQLAIHAQLSTDSTNINVAYICTEDVFPIKRLHQMIELLKKHRSYPENMNFMDNIHIAQIGDLPSLWNCVNRMLPSLLQFKNVKLVIIDSVGALFRCEYELNQSIQRSKDLQKLGFILHKLATRYKAGIVCINQVTDDVDGKSNLGKKTIPALGLTWSNLVHTRLMLSQTNMFLQKKETDSALGINIRLRTMEVVFAPHLPSSSCHFVIRTQGVQGLSSSALSDCIIQNK